MVSQTFFSQYYSRTSSSSHFLSRSLKPTAVCPATRSIDSSCSFAPCFRRSLTFPTSCSMAFLTRFERIERFKMKYRWILNYSPGCVEVKKNSSPTFLKTELYILSKQITSRYFILTEKFVISPIVSFFKDIWLHPKLDPRRYFKCPDQKELLHFVVDVLILVSCPHNMFINSLDQNIRGRCRTNSQIHREQKDQDYWLVCQQNTGWFSCETSG